MEVVTEGKKDLITCGNCARELRINSSDMTFKKRDVFDHYDEIEPEDRYTATVRCPICKHSIPVKATRAQKLAHIESERRADHDL